MALYKDYQINGGTVTVNTDGFTLVVHTNDAVWAWSDEGGYIKLHVEDGIPVTSISILNKDGGRDIATVNWQEKVEKTIEESIKVKLEGDPWMVELVERIADNLYKAAGVDVKIG